MKVDGRKGSMRGRVHLGLHVKIPENYFKILEEGKNVGKFIFRRNVKIPENEPRKRKNPGKFFRK